MRPAGATTLPIDMYRESVEPVRIMQIRLNSTLFSQIIDGNPQIAPSQIRWRVGYEDPLLLEMAIALQHQIEHPTDLSKLYTETATRMMALHLLRHHSKEKQNTTVAEKPLPPKTMRVVLDYIHANLAEDLTLETISEVAGFSSYHLARNFKKWSGESVHQYIVRQRLETAQHLLRSTTHSYCPNCVDLWILASEPLQQYVPQVFSNDPAHVSPSLHGIRTLFLHISAGFC